MKLSMEVDGLDELEKALLELGAQTGFKTLRTAGRKAMAPVLVDMSEGANENTGELKRSLQISTSKGKVNNRAVNINVGNTRRRATKSEGGQLLAGVKQKAIAQEFGTSKQRAEPFMVPALVRNTSTVLNTFSSELKKAIDKAILKANKGKK